MGGTGSRVGLIAVEKGKGLTGSVSRSDVGIDVACRKRSEPQLWVDRQGAWGWV